MSRHIEILLVLEQIEAELKTLALWGGSEGRPQDEAFLSTAPFCIDSMDFHQWLEYVLIVRLKEILENELELPSQMSVHPMAQEVYRGQWGKYRNLISHLRTLDNLVSAKK